MVEKNTKEPKSKPGWRHRLEAVFLNTMGGFFRDESIISNPITAADVLQEEVERALRQEQLITEIETTTKEFIHQFIHDLLSEGQRAFSISTIARDLFLELEQVLGTKGDPGNPFELSSPYENNDPFNKAAQNTYRIRRTINLLLMSKKEEKKLLRKLKAGNIEKSVISSFLETTLKPIRFHEIQIDYQLENHYPAHIRFIARYEKGYSSGSIFFKMVVLPEKLTAENFKQVMADQLVLWEKDDFIKTLTNEPKFELWGPIEFNQQQLQVYGCIETKSNEKQPPPQKKQMLSDMIIGIMAPKPI